MTLSLTQAKKAAPLFAALGDPQRLGFIIRLGRDGPLPTLALQQSTRLSRQAVTKHLQLLERAGLIESQRAGRERIWQLQQKRFAEVRQHLAEISAQWDATLLRLQAFVEQPED
jgi:DNA-binding transcriptional ArsR family regulator